MFTLFSFLDASLSNSSRTGTPHGHHGDSDSDDNEAPSIMRNKRYGEDRDRERDRDQRSSHSSAGGSTMSPGVPASLANLHSAGGLLSSAQPSTVSLGPPLPPPPHLLPYLYPSGLYPGGPSLHQLSQLLHTPPGLLGPGAASALGSSHAAMSHNLLLNAQLALAAQHQLFHPHAYQNLSAATLSAVAAAASGAGGGAVSPPSSTSVHPPTPTSSLGPVNERLRPHRFAPYTLGATSPVVSASASSAAATAAAAAAAATTVSTTPNPSPLVGSGNSSAFETVSPKPSPLHRLQPSPPVLLPPSLDLPPPPPSLGSLSSALNVTVASASATPASDLKNMEKMVNGLDMTKVLDASNGSALHHASLVESSVTKAVDK